MRRCIRSRSLLVLSVTTLATLCIGVSTSAAATATAESCDINDVYLASSAQLAACGLTTVPLSGTTALAGGGVAYNYQLPDGQMYSINRPPAGFNATTATAAEDAAYGLPPAPSASSPGYASWLTMAQGSWATPSEMPELVVGDSPVTTVPGSSSASPAITVANYSNWAGYTRAGSGWTENQNTWVEPAFGSTSCSGSSVSFWAGIGNQADALGQDGTVSGAGTPGLHYVFYENLPASEAIPGPQAPPGDQVIANVRYYGSNNWEYIINVGGTNYSYAGTGGYDGSVVEEITERTELNGSYTPLMNFNSVNMYGQVGTGLSNIVPTKEWIQTGYATTGAISGGRFTVTQNSCSGSA